jgi:hypothetical protein
MRKRLIVAVTFLGGIYFIVEFLLPEYFPSGFGPDGAWRGIHFREYHEEILTGLQSVGMAAIGLGLVNIFRVFGMNVLKRRRGWPFSLTLVLAMLTMMVVTFWIWIQDLELQHQVGPLGVQREFQTRLLNYVGRTPPSDAAGERMQQLRDMALLRYLSDTRKAVSPPAVSTGDAAAQLAALARFLKGALRAPAFFQVEDAPENPPEYVEPQDLLDPPKEPPLQPLKTAGAVERLAALVKRREELTDRLLGSAKALKAQTGLEVGPVVSEQAAACRELAPALRSLSQELRGLADAERAVYTEPPDYDLRYRGGPAPAPVPMFGRLYLAARALSHSAHVLEKYAKVLDQAAVEIPRVKAGEQDLADWLDQRAQSVEALRRDWRKDAAGDLERALPEARAKLAGANAQPDPLRRRMLEDLGNVGPLTATYEQALTELDAADAALAGTGELAAKAKAAGEAASRALAALRTREADLRLLRVRAVEQDLSYLDLTSEDAEKIVLPELRAQAEAQGAAVARSAEVLQRVAAAAQKAADELNARRGQMRTGLDAEVAALRKTWREKSAVELHKLRGEEDDRTREIARLATRALVAADAQKMAAEAAGRAAALPDLDALAKLVTELVGSKSDAEALTAVLNARKAVVAGELFVLQDAGKIIERFATKHDMKDARALAAARDALRAFSGAVQADSLLHAAARDSRLAAAALGTPDLPGARKAMESSLQQIGPSQEGLKDALQEGVNRSTVKGLYKCLFDGLYVSLGAAMFSLLAFYIASAAYRAFRVKSAEALLMMIAALLVMLGQIPFGGYLWSRFPEVRLWVLQVFSTPAFRGIALGSAVAFLAMAMRMWLSLETSAFYREEEEGG